MVSTCASSKEILMQCSEVSCDLNQSDRVGSADNKCMLEIIKRASQGGGDVDAQRAIDLYIDHLAMHISALIALCGASIDALVFTAGFGENSHLIRRLIITKLGTHLLGGTELDNVKNEQFGGRNHRNGLISV